MKFKCLVLDHDDTVVDSTRDIHYPAFVEYLKVYKPEKANDYSLEDYLRYNFNPGVLTFFEDMVGLTAEEMEIEERFWVDFVRGHIPTAYEGMHEIIDRFRREGGIVVVDSHSFTEYIERDYKANDLPTPDVIFGWDLEKEKRKPSPWTLEELMRRYDLRPEEILMVDDLKPGFDMARSTGVPFAAAAWAYDVPEIATFMREHCDYYLRSVDDLYTLLFE